MRSKILVFVGFFIFSTHTLLADDFVGQLVLGIALFNVDCPKHPGVWKYNSNSYAVGCSPTTKPELLQLYESSGNTLAAYYQRQGLWAKGAKAPRGFLGGLLGALSGIGLTSAYSSYGGRDADVGDLAWLAIVAGGAYIGWHMGAATSPYADVDPELMFVKAMNAFNAGLEDEI